MAAAHPADDLRVIYLEVDAPPGPGELAHFQFEDHFNDGDPLHGDAFSGAVTGSAS